MKKHPHLAAMLIALVCYTAWSVSDAFVKLATEKGVTPLEVMFFCGSLNALAISAKMFLAGQKDSFVPKSKRFMFLRTSFGVLMGYFFFTAYSLVPLANAYVVEFSAPLLVAMGGALFLSERMSLKSSLMILLGFVGVYVATNPQSLLSSRSEAIGYGAAFAGALCFAASQLLLRKMSKSEKTETIIFWAASATVLFSLIASQGDISIPALKASACLFMASCCMLCGWSLIMMALKRAPAAIVSYFQYFQLITGTALGYIIWHTIPDWNVFVGGAIIIAAGLVMAHDSRKQDKTQISPGG